MGKKGKNISSEINLEKLNLDDTWETFANVDKKIEDLYVPYDSPGINQYYYQNNNQRSTDLPYKGDVQPIHGATFGIKVEDIDNFDANKKKVLNFYRNNRNFANGKRGSNNNDKNIYSKWDTEKNMKTLLPPLGNSSTDKPKNDSEMSLLQEITGCENPLEEFKAAELKMMRRKNRKKRRQRKITDEDKNIITYLPDKFKNSALHQIIIHNKKKTEDEHKTRIKMYMQLSHWYPCNPEYGQIKENIRARAAKQERTIINQNSEIDNTSPKGIGGNMWCDSYLKKTIDYLGKIYGDDVDFRLKAANYGDLERSRQLPGWVQPRQTRYSSELSIAGGSLGEKIPYYKKSQSIYQKKNNNIYNMQQSKVDEAWRDRVKDKKGFEVALH